MEKQQKALWLALAALGLSGVLFHAAQRQGAIGGPISLPKQIWLCYALYAWYAVPVVLLTRQDIGPRLRRMYVGHLCWWGARALVELWMLYVTISWTPLYGIAHDLIAIGWLTACAPALRPRLALEPAIALMPRPAARPAGASIGSASAPGSASISASISPSIHASDSPSVPRIPSTDLWNDFALRWASTIRIGLVPEIIFAAWFRHLNDGRVGVYFADASERFLAVNLATLVALLWAVPNLAMSLIALSPRRAPETQNARL